MSEHAFYMPSGAGIWGPCPAAATALNTMPSPENERTRQGSAAHWLAAVCLINKHDPAVYLGQKTSDGVIIDNEMIGGVSVYVDDVTAHAPDGTPIIVEQPAGMPDIHPDCWGTPDAAIALTDSLYVWDYKHGYAEVSPEGNKQMAAYVKGILNASPAYQPKRIVLTVVQPFAHNARGPVRRWECTLSDLQPIWSMLHASAHGDQRKANAGPHCRYCPARWRCNARRETDYMFMDAVNRPVDFEIMTTHDLAIEYKLLTEHAALIKARIEATVDELEHRIKNGDTSSGLSVGSKAGRLEWSKPPASVNAALAVVGIDARKDGCKTPRQIALTLPAPQRDQFYSTIKPLTKRNYSFKLTDSSETIAGRVFERR